MHPWRARCCATPCQHTRIRLCTFPAQQTTGCSVALAISNWSRGLHARKCNVLNSVATAASLPNWQHVGEHKSCTSPDELQNFGGDETDFCLDLALAHPWPSSSRPRLTIRWLLGALLTLADMLHSHPRGEAVMAFRCVAGEQTDRSTPSVCRAARFHLQHSSL